MKMSKKGWRNGELLPHPNPPLAGTYLFCGSPYREFSLTVFAGTYLFSSTIFFLKLSNWSRVKLSPGATEVVLSTATTG